MAPPISAVFLDIDGVILDAGRSGLEWERLIGEVFAPALGGTIVDWGLANRRVYWDLLADYLQPLEDPLPAELRLGVMWVRGLCRELGVAPPSEAEALILARRAEVHVCSSTTAAFGGARAAIETLRGDYTLHTATGNFSWRVDALLANLGVFEHFEVCFGPDRAGAAKHTRQFYERAFAAAGVDPRTALAVDDNARYLEIAAALGARTALIDPARPEGPFDLVLASIEELPAALGALSPRAT